jgi:BCD family chlorophyll transporter-like MFS transporter
MKQLSWIGIARLGLVQASLGAVVVMATGTLNRVMVIEIGLPALVPGILVAWHYLIQILRPRLGHGSDQGGRRTPWIIAGVAMLGLGAVGAAIATPMIANQPTLGFLFAFVDYSLIGIGGGCAGTSLLVLLAQRTAPERRPAAATLVWIMMIAGFVITAGLAGRVIDPYSPERLITVVSTVAAIALSISILAVWGMEEKNSIDSIPSSSHPMTTDAKADKTDFMTAVRDVWAEPQARLFAGFVFIAMLAYSAQELLLDPFAGKVYGYSPGESTQLNGIQHGGALLGMVLVAVLGTLRKGQGLGSPRFCTQLGCISSAIMLIVIASSAAGHLAWPLKEMVFALGVANGLFAVSAIASMMQMVGQGTKQREGVRMGIWGAAQAVAFAMGGLVGTGLSDLASWLLEDASRAYALVFCVQAGFFVIAAWLAKNLFSISLKTPERHINQSQEELGQFVHEA